MTIFRRCILCLAAQAAVFVLIAGRARADAIYSVNDLGAATPTANASGQNGTVSSANSFPVLSGQNLVNSNGNYLTALSQGQQVAFQAGSFDVYAHPATSSLYGQAFYPAAGGYDVVNTYTSFDQISNFSLKTSNNLGVTAGTANEVATNIDQSRLVTFLSDPHSVVQAGSANQQTTLASPGYVTSASPGPAGSFYGNVSGINDHNNIAYTQYQFAGSQTVLVPHLDVLGATNANFGDHSLGSLGGTNGAAYALNNSNEVVGWSQIASGAPHAFLYSGGSMQDLNSLIPSSSGIVLTSAVGIDAAGEIVAYGTNASGQVREYFLTPAESPVPEPSTLAVMLCMIVALAVRRVRGWRPSNG